MSFLNGFQPYLMAKTLIQHPWMPCHLAMTKTASPAIKRRYLKWMSAKLNEVAAMAKVMVMWKVLGNN